MRISGARTTRLLATAVATGLGITMLAGSPGQAGTTAKADDSVAAKAPTTVYATGFDTLDGWNTVKAFRVGPEGKSKAIYRAFNVQANGALSITTRRHCTTKGQKPSLKNASVKPCGKHRQTKYSSGRVEKDLPIAPGANYEMEFSAIMPTGSAKGTRPALWANNAPAGGAYCTNGKQKIVEFDPLEWWSSKPRKASHTTHIGCDPKARKSTARQMTKSPMEPGVWYQWKVRRVGNRITYWRTPGGGAPVKVATHTCGKGTFKHIGKKRCTNLLGSAAWRIIVNGEVFARAHLRPDNRKRFPAQTFVVDWFEMRQL